MEILLFSYKYSHRIKKWNDIPVNFFIYVYLPFGQMFLLKILGKMWDVSITKIVHVVILMFFIQSNYFRACLDQINLSS